MPSTLARSSAQDAVALRQISKSYDGRPVIADLSLDVAVGEFLAIVGPSGSGKTTMMRLIGGFESPDAGRIEIAGIDVTAIPAERRRVNTVFQSYALFPHLNVLDNVAFGPRMRPNAAVLAIANAPACTRCLSWTRHLPKPPSMAGARHSSPLRARVWPDRRWPIMPSPLSANAVPRSPRQCASPAPARIKPRAGLYLSRARCRPDACEWHHGG